MLTFYPKSRPGSNEVCETIMVCCAKQSDIKVPQMPSDDSIIFPKKTTSHEKYQGSLRWREGEKRATAHAVQQE